MSVETHKEEQNEQQESRQLEKATLGGGCFWCIEAVYQDLKGVQSAVSGYAGGKAANAEYKKVASGSTDHAEVVQITYDPEVISYEEILEIFWAGHDPTTLNRQGNDVGPQYRSVIFYHNEEQKQKAEESIDKVASLIYDDPIVTELSPLEGFYPAEDYHQNYYNNVGRRNPYCTYVITPKVRKIREKFASKLKEAR